MVVPYIYKNNLWSELQKKRKKKENKSSISLRPAFTDPDDIRATPAGLFSVALPFVLITFNTNLAQKQATSLAHPSRQTAVLQRIHASLVYCGSTKPWII